MVIPVPRSLEALAPFALAFAALALVALVGALAYGIGALVDVLGVVTSAEAAGLLPDPSFAANSIR